MNLPNETSGRRIGWIWWREASWLNKTLPIIVTTVFLMVTLRPAVLTAQHTPRTGYAMDYQQLDGLDRRAC
jgi:hypothetical protein